MSETADETVIDTPAADAPEPDATNPRAEIEAAARKGGWTPKEEFTGKPDEYLDAPQFILKGAEILPEVRKALKDARDEIKTIKKTMADFSEHHTKTETRMYERARKELELALDQHTADNNLEGVKAVTKELTDMAVEAATKPKAPQPAEDADFKSTLDAWKAENPWFLTDDDLTAFAQGLRFPDGMPPAEQLSIITARVRKAFPQKFENPRRNGPAAVEAGNPPRGTGKTFNDLPADAKETCSYLVKNVKGFTKEQYVRDFFA